MNSLTRKFVLYSTIVASTLGLAVGVAVPASATQQVVYHYSSLTACSLAMDRYTQDGRARVIQGCTATSHLNGKPIRWRLMLWR